MYNCIVQCCTKTKGACRLVLWTFLRILEAKKPQKLESVTNKTREFSQQTRNMYQQFSTKGTNLQTFDLINSEPGGVGDLLEVDVSVGVGLGHPGVLDVRGSGSLGTC